MLKSATLGSFQEKLKNSVKKRASSEVQNSQGYEALQSKGRSLSNSAVHQSLGSVSKLSTPEMVPSIQSTPTASAVKPLAYENTESAHSTPSIQSNSNYLAHSTSSSANSTPNAISTPTVTKAQVQLPKPLSDINQVGTETHNNGLNTSHTPTDQAKIHLKPEIEETPKPYLLPAIPPAIPPTPLEKLHGYLENPKVKQAIMRDDRIGGLVTDSLEIDVIRRVVDQVVTEHFVDIKTDIQQMHIEILREFQLQRVIDIWCNLRWRLKRWLKDTFLQPSCWSWLRD